MVFRCLVSLAAVFSLCVAAHAFASFENGEHFRAKRDFSRAFQEYSEAAEKGHARSQFWVGYFLETGRGVTANPQQARVWYEKSANGGDAEAAIHLGVLHVLGVGGPASYQTAQPWFEMAQRTANAEVRERFIDGLPTELSASAETKAFYITFRNLLYRNLRWPDQTMRQNAFGQVLLRVTPGQATVQVANSSGSAALDSMAERAARHTLKVVPLPEELRESRFVMTQPVDFRARGA